MSRLLATRLLATRRGVVALVLLAGALAVLAAGRPWLGAVVPDVPGRVVVTVSGRQGAPGAVAAALVVLAAAAALTIAGRVALRVAAVLLVAGGAAVAGASLAVLRDPGAALAGPAAAASGLTGPELAEVTVTPWPTVCAAAGLVVLVGGLITLRRAGRWTTTRRFDRTDPPADPPGDAPAAERGRTLDTWDALSRGDDPTS